MDTVQRLPKTSKELQNAVYDDFKRAAIDAAKKRAVAQHSDYDTFKNMVSVAHLKPIQAPSTKQDTSMAPAFRFGADGASAAVPSEAPDAGALTSSEPQQPPASSGDFQREWRRNCPTPDVKYRYLRLCTPALLPAIFRVEIGSELLGEIIGVLEACWLGFAGAAEDADASQHRALQEASFALEVLAALSGGGRFSLTSKLLPAKAKQALASLMASLADAQAAAQAAAGADDKGSEPLLTAERLAAVQKAYGCSPPAK